MGDLDRVELVVVAYRSAAVLPAMLAELPAGLALTVVDNSAREEDLSAVLPPGTRHLCALGNLGFAAAANLGARAVERPYVVFFNADAVPDRTVLAALVGQLDSDPGCAACAPALLDEHGRPQIGGGGWEPTVVRALIHASGANRLWRERGIWILPRLGRVLPVDWLAGTCLAVRRSDFLRVGGFDTGYFLYQEDMALGRRLRGAGLRLVWRGDLQIVHRGGGSSATDPAVVWRHRARALGRYLQERRRRPHANVLRGILSCGYAARSLAYALAGRKGRAEEMRVYASSIWG